MLLKTDLVEALVAAVAGGIADMTTGEIYYASPLLEEMFGYQVRGELIGLNVDDLVPVTVRVRHTEHRHNYASMPEPRPMGVGLQVEGVRKDGTLVPVAVSLSGVVLSGRRCVAFVILDMKDRRPNPPKVGSSSSGGHRLTQTRESPPLTTSLSPEKSA